MNIVRGNILINTNEDPVTSTKIFRDAEYIGFYFSASWSPPCVTTFLPLLKNYFEKANLENKKFQVIYVSSDTDYNKNIKFFAKNHGPWYETSSKLFVFRICWWLLMQWWKINFYRYSLPPGPIAVALRKNLQVFSIPQLIIIDKKGKTITKNGREELENGQDPVPNESVRSEK